MQDDRDIDSSQELFVFAENQKLNLDDNDRGPRPESYMQDVLAAFSSQSAVPRPDAALISSKRRYGELTGLSKQIAQRVSGDPREFERVKAVLTKELAELMEDDEIQIRRMSRGRGGRERSGSEVRRKGRRGSGSRGVETAVRRATMQGDVEVRGIVRHLFEKTRLMEDGLSEWKVEC